jgi:hypothetical protein
LLPDVAIQYRLTEYLINEGLDLMGSRMATVPGLDLIDFLEKEQGGFRSQ